MCVCVCVCVCVCAFVCVYGFSECIPLVVCRSRKMLGIGVFCENRAF